MMGNLLKRITPSRFGRAEGSGSQPVPTYLAQHDGAHAAKTRKSITDKLVIGMLGISMALNIVLGVCVLQLLPLYRVVPFFVTFSDKADQIVRIEPPTGRIDALDLMTQKEGESYITKRFTISNDPQETVDRWESHVKRRSTVSVNEAFIAETRPIYDQLTERRMTRAVEILAVGKVDDRGLWRVEFQATDRRLGSGLTDGGEEKRTFIAQLRVANLPQTTAYNGRFLNPLGFTVIEFAVQAKRA